MIVCLLLHMSINKFVHFIRDSRKTIYRKLSCGPPNKHRLEPQRIINAPQTYVIVPVREFQLGPFVGMRRAASVHLSSAICRPTTLVQALWDAHIFLLLYFNFESMSRLTVQLRMRLGVVVAHKAIDTVIWHDKKGIDFIQLGNGLQK